MQKLLSNVRLQNSRVQSSCNNKTLENFIFHLGGGGRGGGGGGGGGEGSYVKVKCLAQEHNMARGCLGLKRNELPENITLVPGIFHSSSIKQTMGRCGIAHSPTR